MQQFGSTLFAQVNPDAAGAAAAGVAMIILIIELALVVVMIAGMWAVFAKAGKPGWAAIIPFYNIIVLLEITGKPLWWLVLFLIPCVGIVVAVLVYIALAEQFGMGPDSLWDLSCFRLSFSRFWDSAAHSISRHRSAVET